MKYKNKTKQKLIEIQVNIKKLAFKQIKAKEKVKIF